MANILTPAEAAVVLRCDAADANLLQLLPMVDAYLKNATGRDWAADAVVYPEAKAAARMLLVRWHEDPGGLAAGAALGFGLSAILAQLEAKALALATAGVPDEDLALVASNVDGALDPGASIVLVFSHPMAAAAVNQVRLETAAGAAVAVTCSLDVTGAILTVNPDAALAANTQYRLVIDYAADTYGQTLYAVGAFWTAP